MCSVLAEMDRLFRYPCCWAPPALAARARARSERRVSAPTALEPWLVGPDVGRAVDVSSLPASGADEGRAGLPPPLSAGPAHGASGRALPSSSKPPWAGRRGDRLPGDPDRIRQLISPGLAAGGLSRRKKGPRRGSQLEPIGERPACPWRIGRGQRGFPAPNRTTIWPLDLHLAFEDLVGHPATAHPRHHPEGDDVCVEDRGLLERGPVQASVMPDRMAQAPPELPLQGPDRPDPKRSEVFH